MSLLGDFFSTSPAPSGGLFGTNAPDPNRSQWWDALGLLGAALKDTSARGQSNALGSYAQMMRENDVRAKRNAVAQRLGAAFTQPNQVGVTPAVNDMSAQAPRLRAEADVTNAQPFATPSPQDLAPILAQGIGVGIDPSPYVSLQKLESQKEPRILSPEEMKGYGFRDGSVGVMDENGFPRVLQASDVKSPQAFQQEMDAKAPELKLRQSDQAETARHDRAMEANAGLGGSNGFTAPTMVEADAPGGGRSQFLAQQDKRTGAWVSGDQNRTPLSNVMLPGGVPGGGRAAAQISRIITAAKDVTTGLQNVSELPVSANTGFFGQMMGGPRGVGLLHATREVLANQLSSQDVQDANATFVGIGKALGTLDAGGLQTSDTFMKQLDQLQLKPGDTGYTKMRKLAEMRQMADNALEAQLNGPLLSADQKKYATQLRADLEKSVPWSPRDVSKLEQDKSPAATMGDYAKAIGLAHGAAPRGGQHTDADGIPTVQTPAEAMKLPRGTKFRTPDGRIKVVP